MTLSQESLQAALGNRPVRYHDSVESTNDLAMAWLHEGAEAGSVIIGDEQHKGRGRMGRTWYTPPGVALALSVILRPHVEAMNQVMMLGALAVAEMCDLLNIPHVGVKWPNDVQINKRKVCGVLSEASWEGSRLEGVVLGIGVNVRVDLSAHDLAEKAINIESVLKHPVDRTALIVLLLERIAVWQPQLGTLALYEAWKNRLNMLGQAITVTAYDGTLHTGIAESVDETGALLLRLEDGVQRIIVGDVTGQ